MKNIRLNKNPKESHKSKDKSPLCEAEIPKKEKKESYLIFPFPFYHPEINKLTTGKK